MDWKEKKDYDATLLRGMVLYMFAPKTAEVDQFKTRCVSVAFVFVSVLLACFGELAIILYSGIFTTVCVTVLGLLRGNFQCALRQWLTVAIKCAHLYVLVVLQCIVFRASCWVLLSFSVSFPSLLTPYYYCYYYYCPYISTEPSVQCDECLGWSWVWRAGLVAGLRVRQAFGMFLLLG